MPRGENATVSRKFAHRRFHKSANHFSWKMMEGSLKLVFFKHFGSKFKTRRARKKKYAPKILTLSENLLKK
jgi:hypothetical protein